MSDSVKIAAIIGLSIIGAVSFFTIIVPLICVVVIAGILSE